MTLIALVAWLRGSGQHSPRRAPADPAAPLAASTAPGPADEPAAEVDTDHDACGWFESSYELTRGIHVEEHVWLDASLPDDLALALRFE